MATYREVLDACVLGSDTTNGAALALKADPERVGQALARMASSGAIEPFEEGAAHLPRWRLAPGMEYHAARGVIEATGLVLDDPIA